MGGGVVVVVTVVQGLQLLTSFDSEIASVSDPDLLSTQTRICPPFSPKETEGEEAVKDCPDNIGAERVEEGRSTVP